MEFEKTQFCNINSAKVMINIINDKLQQKKYQLKTKKNIYNNK